MLFPPPRYCCEFILCLTIVVCHYRLSEAQLNQTNLGHAQQGEIFLRQGRWREAVQEFTAALRAEPNRAELHANLGMAYYFKGESASAIPEFQAALHLDQERLDARHGLGLALYDRGDFAGASAAFRRSSQQNPAAYYNLGNALEHQGDRTGALDAYKQYLAAAPSSPDTMALHNAVSHEIFPTPAAGTAQSHLQRGLALLDKKDATGAIAEFLSALRLKPNYAEASNQLGLAFRAAGDLNEAIAAYQTAIRLDATLGVAYRNLAQAFEDKGDRTAAAQGYDRYLLIAPGAADAAEIRAKIAKLREGR
jgi:tetratricopeptide (TPR) repeat protein